MLSLHHTIEPLCLDLYQHGADTYLSVKLKGNEIPKTISDMRETLAKFSPNYPFDYKFFDDVFDRAYLIEQKIQSLFSVFALLAILIASLGLIGLASFTAEQRTKEIGIRKVLGASVDKIVLLLSKEFILLIAIANIIAYPLAYFAVQKWLQNFACRTEIGIWFFVFSTIISLVIAWISVSYQSIKAALANPTESLRYG